MDRLLERINGVEWNEIVEWGLMNGVYWVDGLLENIGRLKVFTGMKEWKWVCRMEFVEPLG